MQSLVAALAALALAICFASTWLPAQSFAAELAAGTTTQADNSNDTFDVTVGVTFGQTEARSMLSMMNEFRASDDAWAWNSSDTEKIAYTDLSPLVYDYGLEQIAMQRAAEISLHFDHTRPDGSTKLKDLVGSFTALAENIAAGYATAEAAFTDWLEADEYYSGQGHRRNILTSSCTHVGIGHAIRNGRHYWVQVFRSPSMSLEETTAANDARTVTVTVGKSVVTSSSAAASPSSLAVVKGESIALPAITAQLQTTKTWPAAAASVGVVSPVWSIEDETIASIQDGILVGKKVGTTNLVATVSLDSDMQVKVPVEIEKPSLSNAVITVADDELVYDGTAKTPSVTVKLNGSALTADDYDVSYDNNVNAGNAAKVIVTGKGDYTGETEATFTISPLPVKVSVSGRQVSYTYDGLEHEASGFDVMLVEPAVEDFPTSDIVYDGDTRAAGVNVGTYETGLVADNFALNSPLASNYALSFVISGHCVLTIEKATVKAPSIAKNLVYNGSEQIGVAEDAEGRYTVEDGSATNAGTHQATVTLADPGNYSWDDGTTEPLALSWTIAKSEGLELQTCGSIEAEYSGKPVGSAAVANVSEGTTIEYSVDDGSTWSTEVPTITNVGSIHVDARATNPNYITVTDSYTLEVTKKTVFVNANPCTKVYGESDPELTATVEGMLEGDDAELEYTLKREPGEDAGNYTITVSSESIEQGNYRVAFGDSVFEIAKAPLTATYKGEEIDFDGTPAYEVTIDASGFVNGDTADTAADFEAPTITAPETLEAGKTYELAPASGNAKNYQFEYVSGKLVVKRAEAQELLEAIGELPSNPTSAELEAYTARANAAKTAYEVLTPEQQSRIPASDVQAIYDSVHNAEQQAQAIANVANAKVTVANATYTSQALKPTVRVELGGNTLVEGTDYQVAYKNNVNAGTGTVAITAMGSYQGTTSANFKISKAAGAVAIKAKSKVLALKAGKSAKASKAFKVTKNASHGKLTYGKVSGNKKITVSSTGKVKVKKGLKKGTYKVKVKATAAATANYNAATSKTITLKVKVK